MSSSPILRVPLVCRQLAFCFEPKFIQIFSWDNLFSSFHWIKRKWSSEIRTCDLRVSCRLLNPKTTVPWLANKWLTKQSFNLGKSHPDWSPLPFLQSRTNLISYNLEFWGTCHFIHYLKYCYRQLSCRPKCWEEIWMGMSRQHYSTLR